MKTVQTDGAALATESFGKADKGTILLVMGATASMAWWPDEFCSLLADAGYQVIRFDHRDTGQSSTGMPGDVAYDLRDIANDLGSILDAYLVRAAHVVGMSLGGLAAQLFALEHKAQVISLTLIAAEPLGIAYEGEGISDAFMQHFGSMADLDWSSHDAVEAFMLTIAELSAGSALPFDRTAALARIETEMARTSQMHSAFNHAMVQAELAPDVSAAALDVPVLIIHGTEDPIISAKAAQTSAEAIAGSRLLLLEGRGHELAPADLGRISTAIIDFTDSIAI